MTDPEPTPILDDLNRLLRMVRDSQPTVLTHPDDYERIKAAAAGLPVVIQSSPLVDAGSMLYLAPLAELWKGLAS